LLPGGRARDRLTLGEGGTPLVRSRVIGPRLGLSNLYFKNETVNPTWSFKDRYVAVTLEMARRFGFTRVVVSSTGNLGISVAAYAAAAGMACVFLAPRETDPGVLAQARMYGAHVLTAGAAGYRGAAEHLARERGWFPVGLFMPWPMSNPFGVEGYRTFAYEMIEDLGRAPAAVLFPCARGNGLYGAWKGFDEAAQWGWAGERPRMVACQPVAANSLEVSLACGAARPVELPPSRSVAVSTCETVAGDHALAALRASGGTALSANEAEIRTAAEALTGEGLSVEFSSALPVACLPKLLETGAVDADAPVVCVLTAAGIRWPGQWALEGPPADLGDRPRTIDDYLRGQGLLD
jgi:threonine synthase